MATCKYHCTNGKIYLESIKGFVDCPDCRNIVKVLEQPQEDGKSIYDKLRIPEAYKGVGVVGESLFNVEGISRYSVASVTNVANLLETINRDLYIGKVPCISCYIHVPNFVDIKQFIYGAQKMAIEKGLGVTPLVSANTIYGIGRVGDYSVKDLREFNLAKSDNAFAPDVFNVLDGYRFIQHTNLTYFDFVHADLCFIDATANTTNNGWTGVADLLSERAKEGLPTFVFGYWSTSLSYSYKGGNALRYIIVPSNGITRLDLLVPYELLSAKSSGKNKIGVEHNTNFDAVKSNVVAGLSSSILRGLS